jgi:hypothetical protein
VVFLFYHQKINEYQNRNDKPQAQNASKQNAHIKRNEDMGGTDSEVQASCRKALKKLWILIKSRMM